MNQTLTAMWYSDLLSNGHDMYHATIQGSSMLYNVPALPSYTIIATDGDCSREINTTAPVTILGSGCT